MNISILKSKIRCEECIEDLTQKNYGRHIQSLKHIKNGTITEIKFLRVLMRVGKKL